MPIFLFKNMYLFKICKLFFSLKVCIILLNTPENFQDEISSNIPSAIMCILSVGKALFGIHWFSYLSCLGSRLFGKCNPRLLKCILCVWVGVFIDYHCHLSL